MAKAVSYTAAAFTISYTSSCTVGSGNTATTKKMIHPLRLRCARRHLVRSPLSPPSLPMPALPSSSTISRTECYVIRCATSTSGRSAVHCAASIAGNYAFSSTLHATPSAARPAARSAVPTAPSATPLAAHLLTTTERCPARHTSRATVHSAFYNAISGTALRSMAPSDALSVRYG